MLPWDIPVLAPPSHPMIHRPHAKASAPVAVRWTPADQPKRKAGENAVKARQTRQQGAAELRELRQKQAACVVDTGTGAIQWNPLLQESPFAEQRAVLSSIFTAKAADACRLTEQEYGDAVAAATQLKQTLKGMICEVRPQTYCEASRFISDLRAQLAFLAGGGHAARIPVGTLAAGRGF